MVLEMGPLLRISGFTRSLSTTRLFAGFAAGFIAVLVFHQGMVTVLHLAGLSPNPPFPVRATPPFGVPQIWSLAFWGGIWGMVLAMSARHFPRNGGYWLAALAFGAFAPTLVGWFVVQPLRGQALGGGWNPIGMARGLLLNGIWGLGTAWLLRWRYTARIEA